MNGKGFRIVFRNIEFASRGIKGKYLSKSSITTCQIGSVYSSIRRDVYWIKGSKLCFKRDIREVSGSLKKLQNLLNSLYRFINSKSKESAGMEKNFEEEMQIESHAKNKSATA